MANKKNMTMNRAAKVKADDSAVMKVMVALVLMCASLMALRSLREFYGTIGGMELMDPLALPIAIAGFVLFIGCCAAAALWKNAVGRIILPSASLLFLLTGFTGLSMKLFWITGFSSLFFMGCAMFVLYIILQLYHWEFFLFSLVTVSAGFAFFTLSSGFSWSVWNTMTLLLVAVIFICTLIVTLNASRHTGTLVIGKKEIALFYSKFNPTLLYVACGLWIVGVAAALMLGSLFAYYCMFAAIAVEFIAAVYYTFQLN